MSEAAPFDYSQTLFLPQTEFPMRGNLPALEPVLLAKWEKLNVYGQLRAQANYTPAHFAGHEQSEARSVSVERSATANKRVPFILHDGPPYANGNLHIGHALNKILKDFIVRSRQMQGYDAPYIPGWDCHGLPIEWKVEEENRAKGRKKDDIPVLEFRKQCRDFAAHWVGVQSAEFQRLGVIGDWNNPYTTMKLEAEAAIAGEVMKFAKSGALYRGSKPVMWSSVEGTALAEAEIEYQEVTSTTIFVKFPVKGQDAHIIIWTTTPWTIPANRAIGFSNRISYGMYEITAAPEDNWGKIGEKYILANNLAENIFKIAKVEEFKRLGDVNPEGLQCAHPFAEDGYDFTVPVLHGEFVTDDTGTGFVHIAPGHGPDDFGLYLMNKAAFEVAGTTTVPETVDGAGRYYEHVPLFAGVEVYTEAGKTGPANEAVIAALAQRGRILSRGRLRHTYPHSWRSKTPVIFRNTPQWFISMQDSQKGGLREVALGAIDNTKFYPETGRNRLYSMVKSRPDWVISRQRTWGVPIAIFVNKTTGTTLVDEAVNARILAAFQQQGADAWYAMDAAAFLQPEHNPADYEQIMDIVDVWFESGSTHAFVMEPRHGTTQADLYLEGTDQHRGWFQSSLLESCGTRGYAPFKGVLTHGFVLDEQGRKMSKSVGNVVAPQDVMNKAGADILRLWVAASDYEDDLRIGQEILKTMSDSYRKIRNTIRWMLGSLAHDDGAPLGDVAALPSLERYMLARLFEVGTHVQAAYDSYDYKEVYRALLNFCASDLSSFYFDIRKDTLYCEPLNSPTRRASLAVLKVIFESVTTWFAPILSFTCDEAWAYYKQDENACIHFEGLAQVNAAWQNEGLIAQWALVRDLRRVVTGALEIERAEKRIGSSLEAAPIVYIKDDFIAQAIAGLDMAEVCITSGIEIHVGQAAPEGAYALHDVRGVGVVSQKAIGQKCARSWRISPDVGSDAEYPDLTPRDAQAMRQWKAK